MAYRDRIVGLAFHGLLLCACNRQSSMTVDQSAQSAAPQPSTPGGPASDTGNLGTAGLGAADMVATVAAGSTGEPEAAAAAGSAGVAGGPADASVSGSPPDTPDIPVLDPAQWQPYAEVTYPPENPYSEEKAVLGKALFWDEQLSSDDTVACGTCHRPAAGGSDPRTAQPGYVGHPGPDGMRGTDDDPRGSPGIAACQQTEAGAPMSLMDEIFGTDPRVLFRRAQTTLDAMFNDTMFWDGRVGQYFDDPVSNEPLIPAFAALEAQAVHPVLNTAEMACEGRTWEMAASKIAASKPLALASALPPDLLAAQQSAETYPALFEAAFGDDAVTPARIVMAIATYERTLTANQTPWDRWQAGEADAMKEEEKRGFEVFATVGNCICCHRPPMFNGSTLFDDGFWDVSFDGGAAQIDGMPGAYENPQFRVVTTRNAGLREPGGLLHDGLTPGTSLEALVAAYNEPPRRSFTACRRALELTDEEQTDLVSFLRNGLTDPRAASEQPPFDRPKLASEQ